MKLLRVTGSVAAWGLIITSSLCAQITWTGIYDFEIKKGGKDSRPESNKVSNAYLQLNVRNLQLFLLADVTDDVSFFAKIATDTRGGADATTIRLEVAHVTFSNIADGLLNLSAGRILTPFGAFTRRQLSPDNPLIGIPLFFYYATNVSPQSGYLDSTGVLLSQFLYGGRLSTVYYGGYYTGIELFGSVADGFVSYDVALMNAPLSSPNSAVNLDRDLAFHGRLALRPAIWGEVGASFSTGSFLQSSPVNALFESAGGIGRFKQQTIGLDVALSYVYYELYAEYIRNRYDAPYMVYDYTLTPPYRSALTSANAIRLLSDEVLVDLKVQLPFSPGVYVAGRLNTVIFGSITDPSATSSTFGQRIRWDRNVTRTEAALGYKPVRNVLLKVGYQWTRVDVDPRPDLDVAAVQVSVTF